MKKISLMIILPGAGLNLTKTMLSVIQAETKKSPRFLSVSVTAAKKIKEEFYFSQRLRQQQEQKREKWKKGRNVSEYVMMRHVFLVT